MSLRRACPLCAGRRARTVWNEDGLRYVRCAACGCVFSDVDAETYKGAGRNLWHDADVSEETAAFYGRARKLSHEGFLKHFPPRGGRRLLDVGCGLGYFVAAAAESGWETYGCDTSPSWVEQAKARTGSERIALSAPGPGLFGGGFDMVTAWDVLEHVHDPVPFLGTVASLLAPGGRAFIRTPNLAWILPTYALRRHLLGEAVKLGPLNHVVYFTVSTLSAALRRAGLEPLEWPGLPPPQVSFANRDPAQAGRSSAVTRLKNLHAATAEQLSRASRARFVLGQDLDVIAG